MLSAEELVSLITSGWSVHVIRKNDHRRIKFSRLGGIMTREEQLSPETYEQVFERAMTLLAEGHPQRYRVDVDVDFYGNLHGVVRTGLFGAQSAQLRISPRHLSVLGQLVDERSATEAAVTAPVPGEETGRGQSLREF